MSAGADGGSRVDIAIVGCGAAGLMAGIAAGRALASGPGRATLVALDGARTLGAKILVAGGGRCNVTHDVVDETAFAGSSRNAIRKVLLQFGVAESVEFFRERGVEMKREETGKLFPVSDDARSVLNALLGASRDAGVEIRHPMRVVRLEVDPGAESPFRIDAEGAGGTRHVLSARRVILATGGMSLPKSGSDGFGYTLARGLGHSITPQVFPALVPLTLERGDALCELSGLAVPARLELRAASGKKLQSFTDSLLLTHFGLSGPCALDMSRYWTDARGRDAGVGLVVCWIPAFPTLEAVDEALRGASAMTAVTFMQRQGLPERLARAICAVARAPVATPLSQVTREARRGLAGAIAEMPLRVTGDRGFNFAEVTAGGVPLSELRLETMESRVCPGLHLCGEICDVDGRIGGYNFQWAWASGWVAGRGAVQELQRV